MSNRLPLLPPPPPEAACLWNCASWSPIARQITRPNDQVSGSSSNGPFRSELDLVQTDLHLPFELTGNAKRGALLSPPMGFRLFTTHVSVRLLVIGARLQ